MIKTDKTLKFVLVWIAFMLTILAMDKIFQIPVAIAQEDVTYATTGPAEIIIKEPIKINIVGWSAYPSQAIKVKIDDPWPAKIEIEDDVKVKGELKLKD